MRAIESARTALTKAMPFYLANSLIPPLILLLASRHGWAYVILWPIVAYEVACILSLLFLYMARSAVSDYSLLSARRLMLISGTLGLFTALIAGGLLTLSARKRINALIEGGRLARGSRFKSPK